MNINHTLNKHPRFATCDCGSYGRIVWAGWYKCYGCGRVFSSGQRERCWQNIVMCAGAGLQSGPLLLR